MATRSLGSLTLDLVAKTGAFEQGMDRAARTADKRMKDLQRTAKLFGVAIGASISGALATGVTMLIRNTMQAEQTLAQLDAILKSTGQAAGYTRDQLVSMAAEFQKKSTFGTNEIIEAQTRLLSYSGVVGENIPRAMQAVIDQSTRLGMSLSQSAETIGRALESPAKAAAALAQQGFGAAFTKEVRATIDALVAAGREADAQILILEILEESYGGAAEAARDTFGGALAALKHTISDVLTGGSGDLNGLATAVNDLNDALNSPGFRQGTNKIKQAFFDFATEAVNAIEPLMQELKGVATVIEGMGIQAEAAGIQIAGMFKLSMQEIRRGQALMNQGGDLIGQGLRSALGPITQNPFRNVRGGVTSTYDSLRTVDTTGLDISEKSKTRKAAMSAEEREAERLRKAYESLTASMKERIALFNTEGEAAKVAYDLEHGALKNLDPARKQEIQSLADQYDAMVKLREENKARMDAAEEESDRINRGLQAGKELLSDLQFELELMKMTNAERATAIQLRGMEAEAVARYGDEIAEANRKIQESMDQIQLMDGMRDSFATFFEDVIGGTKSIKDAFTDMLDSINRMILKRITENWVEQLFGAFGTNQGGSLGGSWFPALAGLFGGGKAGGGFVGPNRMYEVNEAGMEMLTVRGRDYLLTGGNSGNITPAHQIGGGRALSVTQQFINPVLADRRSDTQREAEAARRLRRVQRYA